MFGTYDQGGAKCIKRYEVIDLSSTSSQQRGSGLWATTAFSSLFPKASAP
jgi:hypothetical protein